MGKDGFSTYFQWMKSAFPGFKDEQYKPYNFNPGAVPRRQDVRPAGLPHFGAVCRSRSRAASSRKVFLLADNGYDPYSTTIEAKQDYLAKHPDMVQRFVDASIIGWYNYLYGDNKAANDADQEGQPRDDRRADRLLDRQDEGIRHRRFGRRAEPWASAA